MKIAIDPLLYTYQKLGMLIEDIAGTNRTVHLAMGVEDLPLLDECAHLVICRNALDHMHDPAHALEQMWRILKADGRLFLSVDLGGFATPDEPTVFSAESLGALLQERFDITRHAGDEEPHSGWRPCSMRILARKKPRAGLTLDKEELLQAYIARLGDHG